MTITRAEVDQGYRDWGESFAAEGWMPYLLTFKFRPLGGSEASVRQQMEREVERVYAKLVSRVVRKPRSASAVGRLPVWFCSPDRPVFKHERQSRISNLANDGAHMHATAFQPPCSRLRTDLVTHFTENYGVYVRPDLPLVELHAVPISHRTGYVVGYARKHIGRGLVSEDAQLVLPRARKEMGAVI